MNRKLVPLLLGMSLMSSVSLYAANSFNQAVDLPPIDANPWAANPPPKFTDSDTTDAAGTKIDPWSNRAVKREMSDQQITEVLVKGSVANFTGDCPCPYSTGKDGKKCGDTSEYIQVPGELLCYPEDVTQKEIFEFRAKNRIPNPNQPWMIYR